MARRARVGVFLAGHATMRMGVGTPSETNGRDAGAAETRPEIPRTASYARAFRHRQIVPTSLFGYAPTKLIPDLIRTEFEAFRSAKVWAMTLWMAGAAKALAISHATAAVAKP